MYTCVLEVTRPFQEGPPNCLFYPRTGMVLRLYGSRDSLVFHRRPAKKKKEKGVSVAKKMTRARGRKNL